MLKNFIKVAFRNILKQKSFAFINVLGLTTGVAAFLLMSFYVVDEWSYDKFHENSQKIYRVHLRGVMGGQEANVPVTCYPLAKTLVSEIPEVEQATRLDQLGDVVFSFDDQMYTEEKVFFADSNFFEFWSFKLLEGNPSTALKEPNSIVLTKQLAEKYFGEQEAIGKLINNGDKTYKVTGIAAAAPSNSHIKFHALISFSTSSRNNSDNWLNNNIFTYFVFNDKADIQMMENKYDGLVIKYVGPTLQQFMGLSLDQFIENGGAYGYYTMPLEDIHLKAQGEDELEPAGNETYVVMLAVIAVFVLIIACINFMNLSTAKSAGRAKEVGLRKTLGSQRGALMAQFMTESMIFSFFSTLAGAAVAYVLLPEFNALAGKTLDLSNVSPLLAAGILFSIALFVGVLAGSYPAFYLTGFNPAQVLKGKVKAGVKSGYIRSFLVTSQFWISIVLIICSTIVYQQLQFFQEKNLGFDKDKIVVLSNVRKLGDKKSSFKNELLEHPNIEAVSYSIQSIPNVQNSNVFRVGGTETDHLMTSFYTDADHAATMNFQLVEGRFFSKEFLTDSAAVVINEATLRELGWTKEEALSKELIVFDSDEPEHKKVIGVIMDFNYTSLREEIRPMVFQLTDFATSMAIRYSGADAQEVIKTIEGEWDTIDTGAPFEYSFLDQEFDALFRSEQRMGKVFTVFTSIAIFIGCLGLFGLAAFMAEQRSKEIGIRKVLGANIVNVSSILNREFTKLILISFVLAVVPSYYLMDYWLHTFAFRIDLSVWPFLFGGAGALLIAWLTVSYQAIKAALVNPIDSLKSE